MAEAQQSFLLQQQRMHRLCLWQVLRAIGGIQIADGQGAGLVQVETGMVRRDELIVENQIAIVGAADGGRKACQFMALMHLAGFFQHLGNDYGFHRKLSK